MPWKLISDLFTDHHHGQTDMYVCYVHILSFFPMKEGLYMPANYTDNLTHIAVCISLGWQPCQPVSLTDWSDYKSKAQVNCKKCWFAWLFVLLFWLKGLHHIHMKECLNLDVLSEQKKDLAALPREWSLIWSIYIPVHSSSPHYKIMFSCKWSSPEFCMSLQARRYCSPPYWHASSEMIICYQDYRGYAPSLSREANSWQRWYSHILLKLSWNSKLLRWGRSVTVDHWEIINQFLQLLTLWRSQTLCWYRVRMIPKIWLI